MAVRRLEEARHEDENRYARTARAARLVRAVRRGGHGVTGAAGEAREAGIAGPTAGTADENPACIAGKIPHSTKVPTDRTAYGTLCTPRHPLGAPLLSAEGTRVAFHNAGRR